MVDKRAWLCPDLDARHMRYSNGVPTGVSQEFSTITVGQRQSLPDQAIACSLHEEDDPHMHQRIREGRRKRCYSVILGLHHWWRFEAVASPGRELTDTVTKYTPASTGRLECRIFGLDYG